MKNKPLVSVIIPAYNAGKYIEMAVNSALNQSYPNIEVVVINDGSTDDTLDVLSRFPNIVLISTENKGVSNARNMGIEASKGEYISFLDADDELDELAVESMLNSCLKYNADICGGQMNKLTDKYIALERCFDQNALLKYCIEDRPFTYSSCAKIYKKDFIDKTRFKIGYRANEDSFFIFELALKNPKCVSLNKIVYHVRVVLTSASRSRRSDSYLDINRLAKIKYEKVVESYPQYKDYAKNILVKANMASLKRIMNMDGNYREYENECIKYICLNAKCFIPATDSDKKLFFLITHHLYRLFKIYLLLKKISVLKKNLNNLLFVF